MTAPLTLPADAGEWCWIPAPRSDLDILINELERRWGIGRLPMLVSPELAERFRAASDRHGAGPTAAHTQADLDAMMARAWRAMDAEAVARGASPLPPAIHEIPLEGCPGAVAAICLDDEHAQALQLRARAEGRTVSTWTIAEVVRVIQSTEIVNRIKQVFPGAAVQRRAGRIPDDPIPFGGEDDE